MKPEDDRCEEHGMYLYRTGFGWSCKLGCYYTDDPQKIKDGFITQYKEELKDKIFNKLYDIDCLIRFETEGLETMDRDNYILNKTIKQFKKEILELIK